MSWRRWFYMGVAVAWLMALGLVAKSSLDHLPVEPWGNPIGDGLTPPVAGNVQVGQSFVAPLPGLYRIEVMLDRASAAGTKPITFHLKTDPAAVQDLLAASLTPAEVQAGIPYGVEFPVLRDSMGQHYYFYLDSLQSTADDAISVRYGINAVLDGASAYVNGQPIAGNLQFHTFYSLRTRERLDLLLTRMAKGKPYMFGSKGFYIGLGLVYALVLGGFLLQVARAILTEQEEG
jgi:hypothetical protein